MLINQQLDQQQKELKDNDNKVGKILQDNDNKILNLLKEKEKKVGKLINSLKTDNANQTTEINKKVHIIKKSSVNNRNILKEKYKELGGNDDIILNSTRKSTIEDAIKKLEKKKDVKIPVLTDYFNIKSPLANIMNTPTSGILNTGATEPPTLADYYQEPVDTPMIDNPKVKDIVIDEDEEIVIEPVRRPKRIIKKL
jgi:hypothetical protein